MERIDGHLRVSEYDGAYKCLDCQAQWGALPGHPKMPEECNRKVPLKPCPFCGGEAEELWPRTIIGNEAVRCKTCLASVPCKAERLEWNRRTGLTMLPPDDTAGDPPPLA